MSYCCFDCFKTCSFIKLVKHILRIHHSHNWIFWSWWKIVIRFISMRNMCCTNAGLLPSTLRQFLTWGMLSQCFCCPIRPLQYLLACITRNYCKPWARFSISSALRPTLELFSVFWLILFITLVKTPSKTAFQIFSSVASLWLSVGQSYWLLSKASVTLGSLELKAAMTCPLLFVIITPAQLLPMFWILRHQN